MLREQDGGGGQCSGFAAGAVMAAEMASDCTGQWDRKEADGPDGGGPAGLVASIYTEVPEVLHPVARFSVWANLRKLADEGTVKADDADDPDTTWRASA